MPVKKEEGHRVSGYTLYPRNYTTVQYSLDETKFTGKGGVV